MKLLGFAWFLVLGILQGDSIRITRFVVPSVAMIGDILQLDCAYNLENDQLYDVKWYKDVYEFFRCKSDGQVQAFNVEGVQVYHNQKATLGSCPVSITILNNQSAGQYHCEISTEAPEFKTTAASATLRISNIKPSRRIQNGSPPVTDVSKSDGRNGSIHNGTLSMTESSVQKNGSLCAISTSRSFTYTILISLVTYVKIKVVQC